MSIVEEAELAVVVTLPQQFYEFAKLSDPARDGSTISLYNSDYWMRQAKVLEDRKLTMTDTGLLFNDKFSKSELNFEEWCEFLKDLCELKGLDKEEMEVALTNCGLPGLVTVQVPEYREFFRSYRSKNRLVYDAKDPDY